MDIPRSVEIFRARINQPSKQQKFHYLHGKYCIAVRRDIYDVTAYFTEGHVHSMQIPNNCLDRIYLSSAG